MAEHLQSGFGTIAPKDSAWQAMPHFAKLDVSIYLLFTL